MSTEESDLVRSLDGGTTVEAASDAWLCVDLDGSLIHSDLLVESAALLARHRFRDLPRLAGWLKRGKACLKSEIARRVSVDVGTLPYNEALLERLRDERARGRRLCLATACTRELAEAVAAHLGLFDAIVASDERNLSGRNKAEALVARFGDGGFDYVGNDEVDLRVWRHARQAWVIDPSPGLLRRLRRLRPAPEVIRRAPRSGLRDWAKALRLHQWLKNLLIFVPALAAHDLSAASLMAGALAFLAFGLCASSVYLLNDLLDLPDDRAHRTKRTRPFAAGYLPVLHGVVAIPLLLVAAFGLAAVFLPLTYFGLLALYFLLTLAYSLYLKRRVLVDVFTLAGLYTLRILAGAAATATMLSFWMMAFSMFIFLSLALVKRYTELVDKRADGDERLRGRGYAVPDLAILGALGGASGFMAVLVLALYLNSPDVAELYSQPGAIWLACPLLLYWISRVWLLAHRGQMHDDPIVFAVGDRTSQLVLGLKVAVFLVAA